MSPTAITLIAWICGLEADAGRYVRDCNAHVEPVANVAECKRTAAALRAATPAGVKVVWHECSRRR